MAVLNFFGKQKKEEVKKKAEKPSQKTETKKEEEELASAEPSGSKEEQKTVVVMEGNLQIVRPHITEKATDLAAKNQYVFVVQTTANKKDIARSVEKMYGVNVKGVRIVNVHPKKMRLGKIKGVKKGYKKAMVQIQKDQKIEILPT